MKREFSVKDITTAVINNKKVNYEAFRTQMSTVKPTELTLDDLHDLADMTNTLEPIGSLDSLRTIGYVSSLVQSAMFLA